MTPSCHRPKTQLRLGLCKSKEINEEHHHSSREAPSRCPEDGVPQLHKLLRREKVHTENTLEVDLNDPGYGKCQSDEDHEEVHEPESLSAEALIKGPDPPELRHGKVHHRKIQHGIGAEKCEVPVRCRDLGAMGPLVDLRQRVGKPPDPGAEKVHDRTPNGPVHGNAVRDLYLTLTDHPHGIDDHEENWQGLQGAEDPSPPQPVSRGTDPVIMMPCAHYARKEHKPYLDIEPLLDLLTLDACELHEHERHNGAGHQFPCSFHPEMDHPPPPEVLRCEVLHEEYAEEEHARKHDQATQEHALDHGPLFCLHHGHEDIKQKHQGNDDDAELQDCRLFQERHAP